MSGLAIAAGALGVALAALWIWGPHLARKQREQVIDLSGYEQMPEWGEDAEHSFKRESVLPVRKAGPPPVQRVGRLPATWTEYLADQRRDPKRR